VGVTSWTEPDGPGPACRAGPAGAGGPRPSEVDARLDTRQGRIDSLLVRYVGYVGLVIGLGLSPVLYGFDPQYVATIFGLSLASGLLTYVFVTRTPSLAERPPWGPVYLVGLITLTALLCHQSALFGFQAFAGYIHSFAYLRGRARWLGHTATAVVVAYGQIGGSTASLGSTTLLLWLLLAVLNAGVAGMFMYFSELSSAQSERRRAVIADLNEANHRLSETLEENAALQARLLASAREAGVLDERARLAREIHDTIAQGLTGVVAQLEAAAAADGDPVTRRRHSDTAMALARESLTDARRSVQALTPGQLDRAHLPDAIAEMAKRWGETAGVDLVLDTTGNPVPLLPELEVVLFRVAQEALANVGKHAGARRVGLTLSYMGDVVVLDVRDDGQGFAPADVVTTGESGYGLTAMEQRVRQVSGTFTVESAPGEGTALSASVPAIPAEVRS
jgi:signal transduction histidine kinase